MKPSVTLSGIRPAACATETIAKIAGTGANECEPRPFNHDPWKSPIQPGRLTRAESAGNCPVILGKVMPEASRVRMNSSRFSIGLVATLLGSGTARTNLNQEDYTTGIRLLGDSPVGSDLTLARFGLYFDKSVAKIAQ